MESNLWVRFVGPFFELMDDQTILSGNILSQNFTLVCFEQQLNFDFIIENVKVTTKKGIFTFLS